MVADDVATAHGGETYRGGLALASYSFTAIDRAFGEVASQRLGK